MAWRVFLPDWGWWEAAAHSCVKDFLFALNPHSSACCEVFNALLSLLCLICKSVTIITVLHYRIAVTREYNIAPIAT